MKKKQGWEKPELTVLVRNKPEESVLQACKTSTGGGPTQTLVPGYDYCQYYTEDDCETDVAS